MRKFINIIAFVLAFLIIGFMLVPTKTVNRDSKVYVEHEWDTLDEIMLYDMYLRENVKGRPAWAKDTAQYKKEWKALYREQGEKLFPEDVQAGIYDSKRAANQSHIEVFEINIKKFEQSGQVEKKQVFCLFDYSRRNPLNRAARTVEWEIL